MHTYTIYYDIYKFSFPSLELETRRKQSSFFIHYKRCAEKQSTGFANVSSNSLRRKGMIALSLL